MLYSSQVFNDLIIFIVTLDMYFYLMNNKDALLSLLLLLLLLLLLAVKTMPQDLIGC